MTRAHLSSLAVVLAALGAGNGVVLPAQIRADSGTAPAAPDSPSLTLVPRRPAIGSLVRLTIRRASRSGDSLAAVTGQMAGEPLHFQLDGGGDLQALGPIPLEASDSVVARVTLTYASGAVDSLRLAVPYPHRNEPAAGRAARTRRLRVSRVYTSRPDSLTQLRIEREAQQARAIGRQAHDTPQLWTLPFRRPRASRITSAFGSGRLFNGRLSSSHGGVDFAGRPGDEVRAANRGVVALVASFFLAGNVVYLDHGAGVVTGYFHLTEATVAVGDTVERGQPIGRVGATGRVTGPHLHWSARYGQHTVDPMGLIALTSR
jgi:murein DD-endopeptidase MepM/ murein hydrolase activator NlpD